MPECIDSSVGVWASSAGRNMLDWSIAGTERTPRKLEASPDLSPDVCNYIVFSINFNSSFSFKGGVWCFRSLEYKSVVSKLR